MLVYELWPQGGPLSPTLNYDIHGSDYLSINLWSAVTGLLTDPPRSTDHSHPPFVPAHRSRSLIPLTTPGLPRERQNLNQGESDK